MGILPKDPLIHSCTNALIYLYDIFDIWHFEIDDVKNCIWKYHNPWFTWKFCQFDKCFIQ
jgi:hypothetical protein